MVTRQELNDALAERHGGKLQEIFSRAGAAIAGLGGLGSNVAFNLARTGIGHLHLIDFDRVDITNLNRQQYFIHQIGMYKTEALKENLLKINPYLDIHTDCVKVEEGNVRELLAEDRYICEAFDKAENKAMLVNTVRDGGVRGKQPNPHKEGDRAFLPLWRRDLRRGGGHLPDSCPGGAVRGTSGQSDRKPDIGK